MKILLIGATGTIGSAIDRELSPRHEIVRIGRSSGDFQVDISNSASIRQLFEKTGRFDTGGIGPGNGRIACGIGKNCTGTGCNNSPGNRGARTSSCSFSGCRLR